MIPYVATIHCAVYVVFAAGIVVGSVGSHPANLYQSLVGSAISGRTDSYSPVIGEIVQLHPLRSNDKVYGNLLYL